MTLPRGSVALAYTTHAERAARGDQYGDFTPWLPASLSITPDMVVEVELMDGYKCPSKVVVRVPLEGTDIDLVLVLRPGRHGLWHVVTVWANERSDAHRTLDRSKYRAR